MIFNKDMAVAARCGTDKLPHRCPRSRKLEERIWPPARGNQNQFTLFYTNSE